jgi:hypothetical protein
LSKGLPRAGHDCQPLACETATTVGDDGEPWTSRDMQPRTIISP